MNKVMILNGQLIEDNKINLDKGYFFGYGVFETILVKKEPIFLKEHLERLKKGLKTLEINVAIDEKNIKEQIKKLKCENCAVKISVSDENILITKRPIPYKEEDYKTGFSIKLSNIKKNKHAYSTYIKSFNYIDNLLERKLTLSEGYNEVIFLNHDNEITEGSVSNIFFVKDKIIHTPKVECGLLNGIVRQWMINNYDIVEGKYAIEDIKESDGMFLTNSLMGIMRVHKFENHLFSHNSLIEGIREKYFETIDND